MQYNRDLSILSQVAAKAAADVTVSVVQRGGLPEGEDVVGLFTEVANGIRAWLVDASQLRDDTEADALVQEAFVGATPVSEPAATPDNVVQLPTPGGFTACPRCNGQIYDNRATNQARIAQGKKPMPAFKCKNADGCGWIEWGPRS